MKSWRRVKGTPAERDGAHADGLGEYLVLCPHGDHDEVLQEDRCAEGADEGRELGGRPQRPIADLFQVEPIEGADTGRHYEDDKEKEDEVPLDERRHGRQERDKDKAQIGADHVNLAMGEVDQFQHPVDKGVPQGDQGIAAADGDTV